MDNLYKFGGAYKRSSIKIHTDLEYNTLELLNEETLLLKAPSFYVFQGKKEFDILQFSHSSCFAISEKLKSILEDNQITGWSCFPINIKGIENKYFAFQNLSKAGPLTNLEALNNYETEFREFDINTWNGSDIFHLKDTLLNVCTERVKSIFESSKITNIEILPL